jgi:lipoprotein-releasing system permease protein
VISIVTLFSFLGILLGVATLIVVMSVMNGFRKELLSKIIGVNGHIFIQANGDEPLTDQPDILNRMKAIPGVKLVAPIVDGQALISSQLGNSGVMVRGMHGHDIAQIPALSTPLQEGSWEGFDSSGGLAIGRSLAAILGVEVGDTVSLIAPKGASTPFGVTPRMKSYPIVAIFEIGMSEYDSSLVYMPLKEAAAYFDVPEGHVSSFEVFLENSDLVDQTRPLLQKAAQIPTFITDWRERNKTFFSALEVERTMMFLIVTLIVLVAAFNIISGMTMLVKEKREDIAILRTIGATRASIMRIFFMSGASVGIAGTFAGLIVGLLITFNVESIRQFMARLTQTQLFPPELYFLSHLPADPQFSEIFLIILMALSLSLLATLYPSWRAANLDPVDTLRYG